tara:strand:+ start:1120 stop:1890 length:771 start_codon:yes stop_codon:yes gene_type:complete
MPETTNPNLGSSPFTLLGLPDTCWPENCDPHNDAIRAFAPGHPEPLIELLRASDPLVVRRGLFVFDELGKKGKVALDAALASTTHPDWVARSYVVGAVLSYTEALTSCQLSQLLPLASDPEEMVRGKLAVVITVTAPSKLVEAIALIEPEGVRAQHERALHELLEPCASGQRLFDMAMNAEPIVSTYMFAAVMRSTRLDPDASVPVYDGDSYIGGSAVFQTMRFSRRYREDRAFRVWWLFERLARAERANQRLPLE